MNQQGSGRFQKILRIFWIYAACVGFITFPLFIMEEAIQMATWGTWAAQNAKDPQLQIRGIQIIDKINTVMRTANYIAGWIQPLSMLGYDQYAEATQVYVDSVKKKIFAENPEVFIGRYIEIEFTPKEIRTLEDGRFLLVAGKIAVISDRQPAMESIVAKGIVSRIDGKIVILGENK